MNLGSRNESTCAESESEQAHVPAQLVAQISGARQLAKRIRPTLRTVNNERNGDSTASIPGVF
jgi:hypothetical protein